MNITVCIPTIPPRSELLKRAIESVSAQTYHPSTINVSIDTLHEGVWVIRNRLVRNVDTEWIAFLDDDDEWKPNHLEHLLACASETNAGYVFSWYDMKYVNALKDPLNNFGKVFDNNNPHHTGSMSGVMVKTAWAREIGFTAPEPTDIVAGEDWRFTLDCVDAKVKIVHLPERTYYWHWDRSPDTHGQPYTWV